MRVAIAGPGIAFWRAEEHGWDLWDYGLIEVFVPDWWHWGLSIGTDFDFARHGHFDSLTLILLRLGPFVVRLLYIDDLRN